MVIPYSQWKAQQSSGDTKSVFSSGKTKAIPYSEYKKTQESGNISPTFKANKDDNPLVAGAKAIGNVPVSTVNLISGFFGAVAHPIKTIKGIGNAIFGAGENLGRVIVDKTPIGDIKLSNGMTAREHLKTLPPDEQEQTFNAVKKSLIDRYGSLEKAKKSATEDPVGVGTDIFTILEGGAGLIRKGEELSSAISKVSKPISDVVSSPIKSTKELFGIKPKPKIAPDVSKTGLTKEQFDTEGIKPPISSITNSPFIKGAEALASKSIFGQKVSDIMTNAVEQIKSKVNDLVERTKPTKVISDENLGKTIQEGLQEYENKFKATSNKIYDEFTKSLSSPENKMGNPPAIVDNTLKIAREVVNQQSKSLFKGVDSRIMSMLEKLNDSKTVLKFDNLKETRTMVGEELAKNPQSGPLKRIYGALTQDMNATIDKIDPGMSKELAKINEAYSSGKAQIESNISQSISSSNPERIAQNLIKRNSADTLKQVKEIIGEKRFSEVSKTFIRQTFDKAVTRGEFDIDKFKKILGEYDKETLDQILNPTQTKELNESIKQFEKYKSMNDALNKGKKISEGSQTAFLQNIKGTGTRIGAIGTAVLTGNMGVASLMLLETGGEYAFTKLFSTDFGRKLLTEGLTTPNLKKLKETVSPEQVVIISNALNREKGNKKTSYLLNKP